MSASDKNFPYVTGMGGKIRRYHEWCACGNKRNIRRQRWGRKRWTNRYRRRNIDQTLITEQLNEITE